MDSRHYRPLGMGVTELSPERCPAGHELGPGQVLIGCMPCLCAGESHRIWMCATCQSVLAWPGCTFHPEWTVWEGVDVAETGTVPTSAVVPPRRPAGSWTGDPGDWFG